jgi:MoxR-like ATPase
MELARVHEIEERLRAQLSRIVMGHQEAVDLMLVALLCQGHVLLHGVPGVAKTLLARTFAASLSLDFQRIQFTPDLMPGDVLGTNLFNFETNTFVLTKGPVFTEILLADEINRTPPKTQAALLQAMQERVVTLEGETHELGPCFMVIATQNPIEQEGTYPLPEAQLDRFLFKIPVGYPSRDEEREMVALHGHGTAMPNLGSFALEPVAGRETLAEMRAAVQRVRLSPEILDYIVDLVRATREQASLLCGASPRAANMLAAAARARAALEGRDFVIPDDVKYLAPFALAHRVLLAPGAEIDGLDAETVVAQVIDQVAAPR